MEIQSRREWFSKVAGLGVLGALFPPSAFSQNALSRRYVKNQASQARAYSQADTITVTE